jgi:hypothetical protein
MNLSFFNYYTLENGYLIAKLVTRYNNKLENVSIKRQKKTEKEVIVDRVQPKITTLQKVQDYDANSKTYNRSFKFMSPDSSVAYIKVKTFSVTWQKVL